MLSSFLAPRQWVAQPSCLAAHPVNEELSRDRESEEKEERRGREEKRRERKEERRERTEEKREKESQLHRKMKL